MILIKNGRVMDPVTGTDAVRDVLISGAHIEAVGTDLSAESIMPRADETADEADALMVIDASGLIVAPGLMDGHVHFRDPGQEYKEDMFSGAAAAAKGGFTTVICMANTVPPVDHPEILRMVQEKGEKTGIHVLSACNVTRGMAGRELVDMEALAQAGAAAFTDDGKPVMDEALLTMAMETAADLDIPISLHEEDPLFIRQPGVNMGRVSRWLDYGGASSTAEIVMTARDCALALHTGASVCIQHISSGDAVDIVRLFKALGADVHAEATPHHFTLTEEAVLEYGTNARMNPPLRTERDRQKIIEGLKDGTIDMIVTDHAPHSREEKARPMSEAPSGIIGLETSLALGIRSLVDPGHISLMQLLTLMSTNPARFYRMIPGAVTQDAPADLVIFSEKELWRADHFVSKADNSPFKGWELPGRIHYTICAGRIIYRASDDNSEVES